jgi:hypothetical protein
MSDATQTLCAIEQGDPTDRAAAVPFLLHSQQDADPAGTLEAAVTPL